ncbi:MAG: hypothetical protein ACRD8O_07705, partial [Bryobacteraceae bacterium]
VWLAADAEVAFAVERKLFDRGCLVNVLADEANPELLPELARISNAAGLITICQVGSLGTEALARATEIVGAERIVAIDANDLPASAADAAEEVCRILETRGFLPEQFTGGAGI